jgi:anti-sigma factor RsiW
LHDLFHDESPHDDLPAYVLDALDADAQSRFEAHLAACDACRAELTAHRQTVELLPYGLTPQQPSVGARSLLLARARAEANGPTPAASANAPTPRSVQPTPIADAPSRPARQRRFTLASLAAAAALAVVVAIGVMVAAWGITGPHPSPATALLARLPGGQVLPLAGTGVPSASARLFVVNDGQRAELVVENLPPLAPGRVYQLWFAEPGQPVRTGGTFLVNQAGTAATPVTIPLPLERASAVAVTEEPAPGSPGPTGPHLLDWAS